MLVLVRFPAPRVRELRRNHKEEWFTATNKKTRGPTNRAETRPERRNNEMKWSPRVTDLAIGISCFCDDEADETFHGTSPKGMRVGSQAFLVGLIDTLRVTPDPLQHNPLAWNHAVGHFSCSGAQLRDSTN